MSDTQHLVEEFANAYREFLRMGLDVAQGKTACFPQPPERFTFSKIVYMSSCVPQQCLTLLEAIVDKGLSPEGRVRLNRMIDSVLLDEREQHMDAKRISYRERKKALTDEFTIEEKWLDPMPTPHKQELKNWLHKLGSSGLVGYRVDVYLFGSMARGRYSELSDVDVAVVCDSFLDDPWSNRAKQLRNLVTPPLLYVCPLGMTFYEFQVQQFPGVINTIRHNNRKIAKR